jgi:hypothetical protein
MNYLKETIGPIIHQILKPDQTFNKKKKSCEINPDKLPENTDLRKGRKTFSPLLSSSS